MLLSLGYKFRRGDCDFILVPALKDRANDIYSLKIYKLIRLEKFLLKYIFISIVINLFCFTIYAQDTIKQNEKDSLILSADTIQKPKSKEFSIDSKVKYSAIDSILFNIEEQEVFLFGNAEVNYKEINIKAAYIEINFNTNLMFAKGILDSTGKERGTPVFTDDNQSFKSKEITYNFKSKKGLIKNIFLAEGENYIHGKRVKKLPENEILIKNGQYTTCELEHPHYQIKFSKAKVIPNDKIITGPAYLCIADVPTPIAIPFGFFPNKKGQASGIVIPRYGESANRGFFLENGGYYLGINDYMDLLLTGDIYTRGSWALKTHSNYNKRYKYNGSFSLNYAINILGEEGLPDYSKNKDFFFKWNHKQSPKASPNSRFSANVNAGTSKYNTFNPTSTADYLSNTFQSNISYSKTWAGKYNFSTNMRHSQNTINKQVSLNLPEIAFSVNRFYPFRKKEKTGKLKWYDNISVNYVMNARNDLSTTDSLLFTSNSLSKLRNGIKHSIPVSSSLKLFKHFTLTNSINYIERWYLQSTDKKWNNDTLFSNNDTIIGYLDTDTVQGFKAAHNFNLSSSLNTRIYGMFQFKRGFVRAVRHVITPTVSFTYHPDFGTKKWGYYKEVQTDTLGNTSKYSIFENGIYGTPSAGESGRVNFALTNNLEIKVKSKKDSISGTKKVVLIKNFTVSTSYDVTKDSLNWSKVAMSGTTTLFKNLYIRYASIWDPYIIDSTGRNINKFEWQENKKLLRHSKTDWALSLNWALNSDSPLFKKKTSETSDKENKEQTDFDIPWNLGIHYTFNYSNMFVSQVQPNQKDIIQTLSFNGSVSISSKWKIGFTSGYDFQNKDFSYTSVNFYRDLHCWEMSFNWIPIGFRKSWSFKINIKASAFKDLKYEKKKDWRDIM